MNKIIAFTVISFLTLSPAYGAGSSSVTPEVSKDIRYYNRGVELMLGKKFSQSENQFRKALAKNERFAEAHNNLAYVLRKQGAEHFKEALEHYNRAIDLKPGLGQPYMYRGVLFVQMGNVDLARKDHVQLTTLDPVLAEELKYVIDNGREKEPEHFFGVSTAIN